MSMRIKTISVHEAAQHLSDMGVPICATTLMDGIEQGKFPFGICIQLKGRRFLIFEKLFWEWAEERAEKEVKNA